MGRKASSTGMSPRGEDRAVAPVARRLLPALVSFSLVLASGAAGFLLWSGPPLGLLPPAFGLKVPTCEPNRVLVLREPPMRGSDVTELQLALKDLSLYEGPVDGVFGRATADAVSKLRARHGLSAAPRVDSAFWQALADQWWSRKGREVALAVSGAPRPEGEVMLVIDIEKRRLTVFADGFPFKTYPVAVGRPGSPSQPGQWRVRNKGVNVGPPFGTRWMGLDIPWGIYGVHGTNNPGSIGTAASGGCIRMFNHHVNEVYEWVSVGTPVHIVAPHWQAVVPPALPRGAVGLGVVFLQWQLARLGFDPGPVDGRLEEATVDAIRDLEAFYGLETDGIADTDVLCLLDLDR